MVRFELDVNLNAISGGENLAEITYSLIEWAETQGRLPDLVASAQRANPGNQELAEFHAWFFNPAQEPRPAARNNLLSVTQTIAGKVRKRANEKQWRRIQKLLLSLLIVGGTIFIMLNPGNPIGALQHFLLTPTPLPPMAGDYNVAVAPFGYRDEHLALHPSAIGADLAEQLTIQLKESIDWPVHYQIQVREPTHLPMVTGGNEEELAESAAAIAGKHQADLLIYGAFYVHEGQTYIELHFHIARQKLSFSEEYAGSYGLGSPLVHAGDIQKNPVVNKELRDAILVRAAATARFVVGLGYFVLGRYEEASNEFELALTRWSDSDAPPDAQMAAQLELFLGSSFGHLHRFAAAATHFTKALEWKPDFARAKLGQAQVEFLQARGKCQPNDADIDGIQRALAGYQAALSMTSPPLADIPLKIKLFEGAAYLCLGSAENPSHLPLAQERFNAVIDAFVSSRNPRLQYLAAEATEDLGMLHLMQYEATKDSDERAAALKALEQAVSWGREADKKAATLSLMALTHLQDGACDSAFASLQDADALLREFATHNPDADLTEKRTFYADVRSQWEQKCE